MKTLLPMMSFIASARAELFSPTAQPSVRRGIFLLGALLFGNLFVGALVFLVGRIYPILFGLALLAWGLGLRHAMDADHISVIDNVTRRLLYRGKPSVGVGFFFSLGHSTVVVLLTMVIMLGASSHNGMLTSFKSAAGLIGGSVSSLFLLAIGTANLFVLRRLLRALADVREGKENTYHGHLHLGGPIEKVFRPLLRLIDQSCKMYGIGFLFGLGFDTATEIGFLVLSALAVTHVPPLAILILPLAFTAGMTLLDTMNSLFMLGIYTWGSVNEEGKLRYGISVTLISAVSALMIGLLLGLRFCAERFGYTGRIFVFAEHFNIDHLGYVLALLFVASWFIALLGVRSQTKEVSQ